VIFARAVAYAEANAAPVAKGRVAAPARAELPEVRPAVCASVPGRGLLLFVELMSCLAISS